MSPGPRASVTLAPWDPESPTHVERMYEQCGWKAGPAERCRGLQRQGVIALQWVVLNKSHPDTESHIEKTCYRLPEAGAARLLIVQLGLGGKNQLKPRSEHSSPSVPSV
ncbi:uncharacterized protein L3040_003804 [Drepanopeziza brunnea f. sp. 'multigermtubi']|uniref:uncharacterized protein n=1 Tax=Drepanopeziza brunnea f. sp. 'multigermtubi' TaxID=698441 RepID=UPI002390457A|nr:hypothetical protein L3040_003804 [Drepanopeziza brunnea f. sp. 'multigermtubi']